MLINCTNKGCLKSSTAQLNTETSEVICADCGKVVSGISEAMKRTLKSFGQILRSNDKKAFMMACKNCNANREVILDSGRNTICKVCKSDIKVHAAMKQAILSVASKFADEGDEAEETPKVKKGKGTKGPKA